MHNINVPFYYYNFGRPLYFNNRAPGGLKGIAKGWDPKRSESYAMLLLWQLTEVIADPIVL